MYNEVINLISQSLTIDEYGDKITVETNKRVYCKVASIGQKEFYQAQTIGLKPEIKFILADYLDYNDEMLVEYQRFGISEALRYKVLRTYRTGNELELVCYRSID